MEDEKKEAPPVPPKAKPATRNKDPDIGKTFWISCRAKRSCTGKEARLSMKFKLPAGGTSIRYTCLKCKGSFHITF